MDHDTIVSIRTRVVLAAAAAMLGAAELPAQRLGDGRQAAARPVSRAELIAPRAPLKARLIQAEERKKPPLLWPWFGLGGAVAGAGATATFLYTNCREGCKDIYGTDWIPVASLGGAVVGFVGGGIIGGIIDVVRRL